MTKYNPMSKEFQEEAKRLGLTGRQLTEKYRKEGKSIEKDDIYFKREDRRGKAKQYTDEQLLYFPIQFYEENGKPPTAEDFNSHPGYPRAITCIIRFESWSKYLKLVELDAESMIKKGIIETDNQKARFSEMIIRDHFKNNPVDLAGENHKSPYDGICPNGKTYDVKSAGLRGNTHYQFGTDNKHKDEIEIYYLLGFNKDYTKLEYGWRIPGEIVESDSFTVGTMCRAKFTVKSMKQYDITNELREVLRKYDYIFKMKSGDNKYVKR